LPAWPVPRERSEQYVTPLAQQCAAVWQQLVESPDDLDGEQLIENRAADVLAGACYRESTDGLRVGADPADAQATPYRLGERACEEHPFTGRGSERCGRSPACSHRSARLSSLTSGTPTARASWATIMRCSAEISTPVGFWKSGTRYPSRVLPSRSVAHSRSMSQPSDPTGTPIGMQRWARTASMAAGYVGVSTRTGSPSDRRAHSRFRRARVSSLEPPPARARRAPAPPGGSRA
jgi:hypothetical protein